VFVNAWLSLGGYRGRGPFLHWLRKIALRTGLAHWRQAERNKAAQPLADATMRRLESAPEAASAAEAAELAHHLLAQLPPRDRLVLTLLHLDERSVAEAAELLGWSETLVKVQAWRARRKLKKLVEVDYG
jgi:RNA polymerase sigma-70 factor (ECF subfamily)